MRGTGVAKRLSHVKAILNTSGTASLPFSFLPVAQVTMKLYDLATIVKPLTSYTAKLTDAQAEALKVSLEMRSYKFREVHYARFAAENNTTNVVFYESGKLVVQGKGTQDFVEFILEPEVLKEARLGYEAVLNPEL